MILFADLPALANAWHLPSTDFVDESSLIWKFFTALTDQVELSFRTAPGPLQMLGKR